MSESRSKSDRLAIRTFICIEIPDSIKERIAALQSSLRRIDAQISWVKPENIHLTIKFLGDVPATSIDRMREASDRAALSVEAFEIEIGGAGCFPSKNKPRVLWVGLTSMPAPLKHLRNAVEDELAREGFPREEKSFSPHLTIGRVRSPKNAARVAEVLTGTGFEPEIFQAEELIVMRSDLNPGGSVYTPQSVVKLGRESSSIAEAENGEL